MSRRFLVYTLYITVVLLGLGWVYKSLTAFEGEMIVPLRRSESVAVRPATGAFSMTPFQRNVPPDALLLDNEASWRALDGAQNYDAAQLPLRIFLEGLRIIEEEPDKEVLQWHHKDVVDELVLVGAELLEKDGHSITIGESATPWKGLVLSPQGQPMAAVALADGTGSWSENLLLQSGQWSTLGQDLSILFRWHKDQASAEAASLDLSRITPARWGVRDGKVIHWFEQFSPGTGVTLSDDTEAMLVYVGQGEYGIPMKIVVELVQGGERKEIALEAGNEAEDILFEAPALGGQIYCIDGWEEGKARVSLLSVDRLPRSDWLEAGEEFNEEIRLQQVMAHAVPVSKGGDTIWQRAVTVDEQLYFLREGALSPIQDSEVQLRYRRIPQAPVAEVQLSVQGQSGEEPLHFTLGPGGQERIGQWRIALNSANPHGRRSVVLKVERVPFTPEILLGLVLVLIGVYGSIGLRYALSKRR